jgi:hypothetical protein
MAMNKKILNSLFLTACLGAIAPGPAPAQTLAPGKPDPVASKPDTTFSPTAFTGIYRLVKNRYIPLDDDYAPLRSYDSLKPSSRGTTVDELVRASSKTVNEKATTSIIIQRNVQLSSIEAQALAYPLPTVAPGNYGYVLSVLVQKVVDKDTAIVSDIQVINEDELKKLKEEASARDSYVKVQTVKGKRVETMSVGDADGNNKKNVEAAFEQRTKLAEQQRGAAFKYLIRLHGYSTESAVEKSRWAGPLKSAIKPVPDADPAGPTNSVLHIAIVGVGEDDSDKKGAKKTTGTTKTSNAKKSGKRVFEAVPVELFAKGITEEQFKDLLAKRGMTPQEVVELGTKEIHRNPTEAAERVVDAIEKTKGEEKE